MIQGSGLLSPGLLRGEQCLKVVQHPDHVLSALVELVPRGAGDDQATVGGRDAPADVGAPGEGGHRHGGGAAVSTNVSNSAVPSAA